MKVFKWSAFAIVAVINIFLIVYLWKFVLTSNIAMLIVVILLCCNLLILVDTESKMLRGITYLLMVVIMIFGLVYAALSRRPLGFFLIFSAGIVIVKNLIVQERKDSTVSKLICSCFTIAIIVLLFRLSIHKAEWCKTNQRQ